MKSILLFIVAILFTAVATAQYEITDDELFAGVHDDVSNPLGTTVPGITKRMGAVRYNHTNDKFIVNNGGGWLTQFNYGPLPDPYGMTGTNTDYFLFQGINEIAGDGGIVVFDTVHFDIGAGNTMNITNHRQGTVTPYGEVSGGIMIGRALYFNNGITTTDRRYPVNSALVFVNNAFYEGGLMDAQHVDGFVSEANYTDGNTALGHNGDFTFPVGNGSEVYPLRRRGAFTAGEHLLTVGWVDGDPDIIVDPTQGIVNPRTGPGSLGSGISAVVPVGFWDWHYLDATESDPSGLPLNGAEALTANQTITVSIPGLDGILVGANASDLRLVGFNAVSTQWENLGTAGASGLTKGSLLSGTINASQLITAIAIGSTQNIILPVTFTSFTVKADGCKALLEWQTGMEQNNSHFVVERSANGAEFTAIARVSAVGNSNTTNTYKFTDQTPPTGVNYYRIKQVDFDGKHSSTDIKAIRIQCNGNAIAIKAYPNPAGNQVNIQSGKAVAQVNIVATNGQTVMKYVPSQNQGGTFSLNIQRVQNGIYLLQIVNKDGTIDVIKLLKQ
ncbi:T9SS type A sorting domain-containing protein [Agriterribacter sp.]|uniref:T9SS type A sorting domain-containing protein n=1 Tax=Agriterribacter sp. TaxID=2821509 RepID=UPI002C6B9957|nr:T9SS type A sorting domain-containing protein [Agriterribacter sp.]HTN07344.1 T9SS type A sorting domain-containing protein [Agriterribacter sp.]